MPNRLTKEQYAEIFNKSYPNYELLSDYNGDKNEIKVKCKIDGHVWTTTPKRLRGGEGCKICYDSRRGNTTRLNKEKFIEKAKQKHGDKYIYSKVDYKNNKTKVCLVCPEHGEFWVRPDKHLSRGDGCPICANIKNGLKKRLPKEVFIKRSEKIHGGKYDYSKVDYQGYDKKVIIICPKHGEFLQSPYVHLCGCGCPICRQSHMENEVMHFLKNNNIKFEMQKRFEWMGTKSLDFFLPEHNIAIECQGLQHFKPVYTTNVDAESQKNEFIKIFKRDLLKNRQCEFHGIKIYYMIHSKTQKFNEMLSEIYNNSNIFYSANDIESIINNIGLFESIVRKTLKDIS